ncbi:hypothetical protein DHODJN_17360 [Methylorubrum extorquens]
MQLILAAATGRVHRQTDILDGQSASERIDNVAPRCKRLL